MEGEAEEGWRGGKGIEGEGDETEREGEKEEFGMRRQEEKKRQRKGRKTGCRLWPPVLVDTSTIHSQPKTQRT